MHKCSKSCTPDCNVSKGPSGSLWICYNCHKKVLSCSLPAESVANNLYLDPIAPELSGLNNLEQLLIARHMPFMKLLCPKVHRMEFQVQLHVLQQMWQKPVMCFRGQKIIP